MRRKPSAAEDRFDPREPAARHTAEHSSPSVHTPAHSSARSGRHRHADLPAVPAARTPDPAEFADAPLLTHTSSFARVEPAGTEAPDPEPVTAPVGIAVVVTTENDPENDPDGADDSVIEREVPDPRPRRGRRRAPRSLVRRLAPLSIAAAAALVAALVAMLLQPASPDGPDLAASLASNGAAGATPSTTSRTSSTGVADVPAPPALADAAKAARSEATTTTTRPTTTTTRPGTTAPGTQATTRPRAPAPSGGDGSTAAGSKGWTLVGGDEFNGSGLSGQWSAYEGAGHAGQGRRTASAVSVSNGSLVIRGDSNGTTGGIASSDSRRFGKWEMRAKFPSGDKQYHPVLILWPTDVGWPQGGEIDFAETNSAASDVSFFLHYSASNQQKYAKKSIDITQWHNYAVEWTAGGVTGYIDGQQWFQSTDPGTLPPGKMHPTIQLDYFPSGGSPRQSEMQVDWMRVYS